MSGLVRLLLLAALYTILTSAHLMQLDLPANVTLTESAVPIK